MPETRIDLMAKIRSIPDFPKKGIMFRDITTLLQDPFALKQAVKEMAEPFRKEGITAVAGIESRGFIFGTALAVELGAGFIPIRKKGKLPAAVYQEKYQLEYGEDILEIHQDAVSRPGAGVLLSDDLLATGGTAAATVSLLKQAGAEIAGIAFLIELDFLNGREKLAGYKVHSLIHYKGEE